ncbi:hypothetical protein ACPW96_22975 [Micromonospora sp. DT81.3]|uniref:hypothetical protein n=1 Tax=Micromonospora sp. DT81.3 TaxID=3416523 RepID=UPI003CF2636E
MSNLGPLRMLAAGLALATAGVLAVASPALAATPVNDGISTATAVTGVPFTDTVNVSEATYDPATDAGCGLATVWYQWTAPADGAVEFNTLGSDYDTTLALFTGEPPNLVLQECNDDSFYGLWSRIAVQAEAGVTYYVAAGTCCGSGEAGQVGPGGNLTFNVIEPAPPVEVTLTIDSSTATRDGVVTLQGTVVCDQPATAYIFADASQRLGRRVAQGSAGTDAVACGTTASPWTIQLSSFNGILFGPGNASVVVRATAFPETPGQPGTQVLEQRVHLKRANL